MKRRRAAIVVFLAWPVSLGWAYPWDQDMVDQPAEKAQESEAPPDPAGVPVDGAETVPVPRSDEESFEMKDAAASIENPVPATRDSIERGRYFYEINCLVCHGEDGAGTGPVGLKFVEKAPVDLNDAYTQDQADGQLFFTLTRGRVKMPAYRDALSPEERWHVINYLRSEFGSP